MQQKPKQKRSVDKVDVRKNFWTAILGLWTITCIFWYFLTLSIMPYKSINWSVEYKEIPSYSTFIETHANTLNIFLNPIFVIFVGVALGIVIICLSRRWWLGLLLIFIIPSAFSVLMLIGLGWSTTLYHVDTIKYGKHIYHLNYGRDHGDMLDKKYLVLFTCDDSGELCTSRVIVNPYASPNSQIIIDENNQLQVVSENRIVFTLEDD